MDSVLKQSYKDFELILVNDGSPDYCPQICDEYAAKDPRVEVVHQNNVGIILAMRRLAGYVLNCISIHRLNPMREFWLVSTMAAAHFCGRIGREEVLKVQKEADVVIFAESLEGKESNAAKLSFSTKITDYISNGKCVLAIGKDNTPIDYFKRNDSALIANSIEKI